MKIAVVGAGAIGGWLGVRLAQNPDNHISVLARGATLTTLDSQGWRLLGQAGEISARVKVSDSAEALGVQDVVIVAVKGMSIRDVAPAIASMMDASTVVLPAVNGIPWWFPRSVPALREVSLNAVDEAGSVARQLPVEQVIGCVVHASALVESPSVVRHVMGNGLIIGEPSGHTSARLELLAAVLGKAGFDVTCSQNICLDVWYKLWGNMTMNPISAMTGATADRVLDDPLVRKLCADAMREAAEIGTKIGCHIAQSPEDRHAVTRKLGAFKTSMLQDALAGRQIELDAIVGAVHEIGRHVGIATPCIDAILGLTRLFAQTHGLYPATSQAH